MSSCNVNTPYNIVNVNPNNTNVIEVSTPGPQGPPGDPSNLTGSFVTTGSFNAFTASYNTGSFTGSFTGNGSGLTGVTSASFAVTASFAQNFNPAATASYALQALTASYAANASTDTGSFATTGSNQFNGNQIITGSLTVSGSSTFTNIGPAIFSGSVNVTQGGITGSLQGTASFAISASQALNANTSSFQSNIQFAQSHIPFFDSDSSMSSSAMRQWTTESIVINREFGTGANPEALYVFQPNPDSINIITAEADIDNYIQLNVFNRNSGSTASSDIVATADNGNEFINYIDMGINSSTFTGSVGGPNDAYLFSTGNDLTIGNATANKHVRFFTGGGLVDVYQKLVLNPDNLHEMTGSLSLFDGVITSSLFGTASFANNAFQATSASYALTASYAGNVPDTASFAISASQAITASFALNASQAVSASFASDALQATTASYAISASQAITASYATDANIDTGSFAITGSNIFSGSQGISGSLNVSGGLNVGSFISSSNGGYFAGQIYVSDLTIGHGGNSNNSNTVVGLDALQFNQVGFNNTAIGAGTLELNTSGSNNTAIGASTLTSNTSGSNNTALGSNTLVLNTTGSNNTALGHNAGASATGSGNVFLGNGAGALQTAGDNQLWIANNSTLTPLIKGDFSKGILQLNTPSGSQITGSLVVTNNLDVLGTITAQQLNVQIITSSVSYITGSTIFGSQLANTHEFTGSVTITGSLAVNDSNVILTNQTSSMTVLSSSYAINADLLDGKDSSVFATTGSNIFSASQTIAGNLFLSSSNPLLYNDGATNAMLFGFFDGGNIYGPYYQIFGNQYANITQRGSAEFVYDNRNGGGSGFNIASFNGSSWTRKFRVDDNGVQVSGSLQVTNGITGSLFGTASFADNALSASQAQNSNTAISASHALNANTAISASQAQNANNALTSSYSLNINGSTNHIPVFDTPNSLVTSAIYQSNSYSIIINQDNNTSAAPEALYVWQPSTSSYNVISGKGNLNNYLQLNIQNLNNGINASSDVVATANNGNETTNYIDMGINGANFSGPIGEANDAYLYSTGKHLHIGNVSDYPVQLFAGSDDTDAARKLLLSSSNLHELTGSLEITEDLNVIGSITGSLIGTASFADFATTASFALNLDSNATASFALSASNAINAENALTASYVLNAVSASQAVNANNAATASYVLNAVSASYASNAELLDGKDSSEFATTGSNTFIGTQIVTGSLRTSGSNELIGNTSLSGSIIISGSANPLTPTIEIFGDTQHTGVVRFNPISRSIDNSISASYIYVSGSTNDLYFTQNGNGYANTTRLRWLEGNLYTGLLNGGLITTQSSTVYQISSGSGIIVNLNASLSDNPYPTIQYLNWPNLSASIAPLTASYQQAFVGIDSTNNIYQQGTPFSNGQFDTIINIGTVLFQNQSTINGVKTQPSVAYGFEQSQNVFNRAFGPLKLSGYTLAPSGSSTGSLVVGSGTAYAPGSNYTVDPNEPYYTVDNGTNTSKIFRYYQSGSTWVYLTNAGAGFTTIDPAQYSNNGTLTSVGAGNWSIQRVFWFPNSVAKAIVVYYGNAIYATESEAIANINIESFVEAPNTAANAVYLGAIVIGGNGVFTNDTTYKIVPGGLFRQVGGSGGGGSVVTQTLSGLSDVQISGQTNLQPLVYSTTAGKWINSSNISGSLYGNAQTATTASFALETVSSSFANNATSASYALTASFALNVPVTASYAISASQATNADNAVSASYALVATSASQATNANNALTASLALTANTASYVLNAVSASYALNATNASTASYVLNAVSASYALSASQAQNSVSASFAQTATSSSFAATSSYADNFTIKNHFTFDATFNDYATIASTITGTNNLFTQATGSFTSGFFKYTVKNGVNARTGEVMAVWNGANITFNDVSTTDIGSTSAVTMSVILVGGDVELNAITNTSGWSVKSLATFM